MMQEQNGPIVRNKQTGQMGRVVNGQVVPLEQSGGYPGIIQGAPDPYKQAGEARAQEDQQIQRENQQIKREELEMRREERNLKQSELDQGQARAAGFLQRAIGANEDYEATGEGPRSIPGALLEGVAPDVTNYFDSPSRQKATQAQRDFISAVLRLESGAVIGVEEMENEARKYFPQPGDSQGVIAQKAKARRRAMEQLRIGAGPKYDGPGIPGFGGEAEPRVITDDDAIRGGAGMRWGDDMGTDEAFDRVKALEKYFGLTPSQEARLVAYWNGQKGNTGLTVEEVRRAYEANGFPMPSDADLQDAVEGAKQGNVFQGIDTSTLQEAYERGLDKALEDRGIDPESMSDTAQGAIVQGALLEGGDELTGGVAALGALLSGGDAGEAYTSARDLQRRRLERGSEANPVTAVAGRFAGALGTGGAAFARAPNTIGTAARIGAVEGGVTGFNAGDGFRNSLAGAAIGAPTGAALGAGVHKGVNALAGRIGANGPTAEQANIIAAGERRGVPVRSADVRPEVRHQRAELRANNRAGPMIKEAEEADLRAIETSVANDLGGTGGAPNRTGAGARIAESATNARAGKRTRATRLYDKAEELSEGVTVKPTRAIAELDNQIAELQATGANANAAQIKFLQGVREDMAQGNGLSVQALRNQRSTLQSQLKTNGLDATDAERRMKIVHDAASQDLAEGLPSNARSVYGQADKLWREQAEFKRSILDPLKGKNTEKGADQVTSTLQSWAAKDPKRFKQLFRELPEAEQAEIRELLVDSLGRNTNGEFSLSYFLKQTGDGKGSTLSPRVMRMVFDDDQLQAISDLRTLSQAKIDAADETNWSKTGNIVQKAARGLRGMLLGGLGLSQAGVPGGLAMAAGGELVTYLGSKRAARLLLNPDFTKWLKRTPNSDSPRVIDAHFDRLRSAASRSPAFLADVQALERALVNSANDNGSRLAAEPGNTDEPRQVER